MRILWAGVWIATVAVGFFLGATYGRPKASRVEPAPLPAASTSGRDASGMAGLGNSEASLEGVPTPSSRAMQRASPGGERPRRTNEGASPDGALHPEKPFDLAGMSSAAEASQAFMNTAEAFLQEGEAGHLKLLALLDGMTESKEAQLLLSNEDQTLRLVVPWVHFLVAHEDEVLDLTETVFRTMAERPQDLAFVQHHDAFSPIVEGVGYILAGAVPEERLSRFREYARGILEAPAEAQSAAIRRVRPRVSRLLPLWVPELSPDEVVTQLQGGGLAPAESLALLKRLPPGRIQDVDIVKILEPSIEQGDWKAIRVFAALTIPAGDRARLDEALLRGVQSGAVHSYLVAQALTGRPWSEQRRFLERGLALGGTPAGEMVSASRALRPPAPPEELAALLEQYGIQAPTPGPGPIVVPAR